VVVSESIGLGDAILLRRLLEPLSKVAHVRVAARRYHAPLYAEYVPPEDYRANDDRYLGSVPKAWLQEADCLILHAQSVRSSLLCARWSREIPTLGVLFGQGFGAGHCFPERDYPHVLAAYQAAADCLGVPMLERFVEEAPVAKSADVLIHLGSNTPCKNWCLAHFVELDRRLAEAGVQHRFVAGRGDIAFLRQSRDWGKLEVSCPASYTEFRDVIRGARVVVCHNTSVLHLAAAYDVPTVSINHPYDYRWWHPYREDPRHIAFTAGEESTRDAAEKWDVLVRHRALGGNRRFDPILPSHVCEAVLNLLCNSPSTRSPEVS
jgi:ADP-heptose:LPS heptosyltransferase